MIEENQISLGQTTLPQVVYQLINTQVNTDGQICQLKGKLLGYKYK
jgi:hypothetical protein